MICVLNVVRFVGFEFPVFSCFVFMLGDLFNSIFFLILSFVLGIYY